MSISAQFNDSDRVPGVPTLLPGEPGYDDSRSVWNAMIDEHPAAIVQCRHSQDITKAVQAAAAGIPVSIRGGWPQHSG